MIENKKVAAIIAEYNPFHNGHEYHIKKTKEVTGADYVIILMSTNYVQRGEPAILDRYLRAKAALNHGATAVFELPITVSLAGADIFSLGGVSLAHHLGFVDFLSFGAEEENNSALFETAKLLHQNESLEKATVKYMAEGLTYPESREKFLMENGYEKAAGLLSTPNNILGISYITSLLSLKSGIKPVAVKRLSSDHHSSILQSGNVSSAKAIRLNLLNAEKNKTLLYLPESSQNLVSDKTSFMNNEDFSDLLFYKLNSIIKGKTKKEAIDLLVSYHDITPDLAHRIYNHFSLPFHFQDYAMKLWGKNYTFSRINRVLHHIVLDLTKDVIERNRRVDFCPYIRPLAIKKDALGILKELKKTLTKNNEIPLLTRIGDIDKVNNILAKETFEINRRANHLYHNLSLSHHGSPVHDEEKDRFIIIH